MPHRRDSLIEIIYHQSQLLRRNIDIVEVGVAEGKTMDIILQQNFIDMYIGVDPWKRYEAPPGKQFEYGYLDAMTDSNTDEDFENRYLDCVKKAITSGKNAGIFRTYSHLAANLFEDRSLDTVFIDGAHQKEYVMQDIISWRPKLRLGGLMIFDDWAQTEAHDGSHSSGLNCDGPYQALLEYQGQNPGTEILVSECKHYTFFVNL